MIDVHFHCLPGIDDGPRDWNDAVALCRAAAADGAETIVATPHVLRDSWINDDPNARDQLILELNTRLGGRPAVVAGCEYYFSSDAVELWEQGKDGPLTGLNRSAYLLVEFPATRLPHNAEAVFHEMSLLDIRPVIAHPERNLTFMEQPDKLERLVNLGAYAQVTAGSIVGSFGKPAQSACIEFFRRRLIHFVASDAHSVARRPPQLSVARERVKQEWGNEAEEGLFEANPQAVLRGETIPWR